MTNLSPADMLYMLWLEPVASAERASSCATYGVIYLLPLGESYCIKVNISVLIINMEKIHEFTIGLSPYYL